MYEHWRTVSGLREFEYEYARVELWGRDLYSHLDDIYQNLARYCVIFLSKHYAQRVWTDHERRSAQARALREHAEYILPTRFDDTIVPGIRETVGYIDLRTTPPEELCRLIVEKIGPRPRIEYFPPVPDRLYKRVGAKGNRQKHAVSVVSRQFFETLQRMSTVERRLLYDIFQHCCPAELPEKVHIDLDLLRRIEGMSVAKIKRILAGISSLGFECNVRDGHDEDRSIGEPQPILVLEWHWRSISMGGNYTEIAHEIVDCATEGYCEEHGQDALLRLDFCQLATYTTELDQHS